MASFSVSAPQALAWTALSFPIVFAFKDSVFSLMRVKGSSMEPSLRDGDILLVRKADFPIWRKVFGPFRIGSNPDASSWEEDPNDTSIPSMRDRRMREFEYQNCLAHHSTSGQLFRHPPTPLRGQIVSYHSPYKYPPEYCIKRVVAVAGQVVETKEGLKDVDINRVWVEGDNQENSLDSRKHGAIHRHLVVGVAEFCVWPPSRVGRAEKNFDDKRYYWL